MPTSKERKDYQQRRENVEIFTFMLIIFIVACLYASLGCCGRQEQAGIKGDPGTTAPPVSVITAPASPSDCPTGGTHVAVGDKAFDVCSGASGASGLNGSDGMSIVGPIGPAGSPGANGIDATPITVVDLCPGVTSYPGVFIEVGLCINRGLYGVYSANGGFMTYLPPGNYSSNAIGSACTLTIGSNCMVSH